MAKKKEQKIDTSQMSVQQVVDLKNQLVDLLDTLEDQHRKAEISDDTYKQTKETNAKKLQQIKAQLEDMGMGDVAEAPSPAQQARLEAEKKKGPTLLSSATTQQQPQTQPAQAQSSPPSAQQQNPQPPAQQNPKAQPSQPAPQENPPKEPPVQQPTAPQENPALKAAQATISQMQLEMLQNNLRMELEKQKAIVDALKEGQNATNEKVHQLTEGMGEIRTLVMQRENTYKEQDIKLEKVDQAMKDLDPRALEKQFAKRDKLAKDFTIRLEKSEVKTTDLVKRITDIQSLLRSVGNLENIATVSAMIAEKIRKVDHSSNEIAKMYDRIQKIYVTLSKNLEDFIIYKGKQDSADELLKELMKNVDDIILKSENFVLTKDFAPLKTEIASVNGRIKEVTKSLDSLLPLIRTKIPEGVKALQKERDDVQSLLKTLDSSFANKTISQKEYTDTKQKNMKRLEKIESDLKKEWEKTYTALKKDLPKNTAPTSSEKSAQQTQTPAQPQPQENKKETSQQQSSSEQEQTMQESQEPASQNNISSTDQQVQEPAVQENNIPTEQAQQPQEQPEPIQQSNQPENPPEQAAPPTQQQESAPTQPGQSSETEVKNEPVLEPVQSPPQQEASNDSAPQPQVTEQPAEPQNDTTQQEQKQQVVSPQPEPQQAEQQPTQNPVVTEPEQSASATPAPNSTPQESAQPLAVKQPASSDKGKMKGELQISSSFPKETEQEQDVDPSQEDQTEKNEEKTMLLESLKEALESGHITKEAYESTKKHILASK